MSRERGQATVEAVAAIPVLILTGMVALQLLLAGCALVLADGAAEAGALALAGGRPAKAAVEKALPRWAIEDAEVTVHGGKVAVRLRPLSTLPGLGDLLAMTSAAYARPVGR